MGDMGCLNDVSSVKLWNTHNSNYHDRGTQAFEIKLSTDGSTFTSVGSGTLKDVRRKTIEPEEFAFTGTGRYLQFIVKSVYGHGAGLQYIEISSTLAEEQEEEEEAETCDDALTVHSEDRPYDPNRFPARYALELVKDEPMNSRKYWILPNSVVNQGFVLDLGCKKAVESVKLWNTHNSGYNDRGTQAFEIQLSKDGSTFNSIGSGTLKDV